MMASLNLANAQFGRALGRRREAAVRTALGAAKGRLVWNALAENLVLAIVGGAGGILLANAALTFLRRSSAVDLPRLGEAHLDTAALLFSIVLTSGASLLSGLLPALRAGLRPAGRAPTEQQSDVRQPPQQSPPRLARHWPAGVRMHGAVLRTLHRTLLEELIVPVDAAKTDTGSVAVAEVAPCCSEDVLRPSRRGWR